ncbi:hypothetical protein AAMO2058_001291700 [Amorphochlora amoebiformis]|mmetsp:Transcript_32507/g.52385  ORF Transcript_32507/g.52385 Transcript_32507/m.52385 type:complete len:130 (-) Transcript_32507:129-518(-)
MPNTDTKTRKSGKKRQEIKRFVINCQKPVEDEIFDMVAFTKYLHDRIKVKGKTGNLGDDVKIDNTSESSVEVVAKAPFSKRYLKYLTKRFLKGQSLRDYIRVIASNTQKNAYELKYFNVHNEEEEENEA